MPASRFGCNTNFWLHTNSTDDTMRSLHCCNFTAGLIQCWAPEVAYSVRQDSQLLGQLSRQVRVPFRADKLETPAVVMCRVCSDSMLNLTSYDSTHSPLASRNMFSSVVWAPFPPTFPPTFPPMFTTNEKAFSLLVQVHIYVSNHIKKPFDISVFFLGSEWHMSRTWSLRHACKRDFISRVVVFWFSEG